MPLQDSLNEWLTHHPKRVVFVEGTHPTAIAAAAEFARRQWGVGILLGNVEAIRAAAWEADCALDKVLIIDPTKAQDAETFAEALVALPPFKTLMPEEAHKLVTQAAHFGALMLMHGAADALVGGVGSESGSLLRPLFQIIRPLPGARTISGAAVVEFENRSMGDNGMLVLADCGIVVSPTAEQLATIVVESAKLARRLSGKPPRVALLSYATFGDGSTRDGERMAEATRLAREQLSAAGIEAVVDGQLQADAALSPEVAKVKCPDSPVGGRANVLIFPDLASGNIALKLLQQTAPVRVYGQVLLGLEKPAAAVAHAGAVEEVVNATALVALQAIAYHEFAAVGV